MPSTAGSPPSSPEAGGSPEALDAALRRLHGSGRAGALAGLHARAAALPALSPEARRFHLTHAWVHALEAGEPVRAAALEAELRAAGGL
ncbi:MAG TPA: hypothetical protein VJ994_12205 [Paracoccaceae bacterium]|nr:hypothetical protein [Paracoccaceae bacterium]